MTEEPRGTGRFTLRKGPRWFLPESPDVIGQLQTQAELTLTPGKHTLQLVLGDHNHVPHDPPVVSDVITVTVE